MATTSQRPSGLGALFMIAAGAWVFLQVTVGELVETLESFMPGKSDPKRAGEPASAFIPGIYGRKALSVPIGVKRGDHVVYETIMPACSRAGGGFVVISWHRPGATTSKGRPSCHGHGKKTRKGALDIVHKSGRWEPVDKLEYELNVLNAGEVLFRGQPNHDPELTPKGKRPHLHAAVNCG